MSRSEATLGVVIVTHRSEHRLPGLLATLRVHEPSASVVIVDSGSPGGLRHDADIHIIQLRENVGYGASCNIGSKWLLDQNAELTTLCFLNPDVLLRAPSLSAIEQFFEARPDIGVATAPIEDSQGRSEASAWGRPGIVRALWFASGLQLVQLRRALMPWVSGTLTTSTRSLGTRDVVEVDGHVLGGAMAVRRRCWDDLGGFDPAFFLYWEDADLCRRALDRGWRIAVFPAPAIVHNAGTSSEGVRAEQRWQWYVDGAKLYARRHLPVVRRVLLIAALHAGRLVRRIVHNNSSR